jgi:hypothetical protein
VSGVREHRFLDISPDGSTLYVAGWNSATGFSVSTATGAVKLLASPKALVLGQLSPSLLDRTRRNHARYGLAAHLTRRIHIHRPRGGSCSPKQAQGKTGAGTGRRSIVETGLFVAFVSG